MLGTTTSAAATSIGHHALAELARGTRPDDCAQDVLLSALVKPPAPHTSLGAWFQGALHLRSLQTARTEGSRRSRELRVARPESTPDAARELELTEQRELLQAGLDELDPTTRSILRAHYWEGMTLTAIADRRGTSLGSVKRRHAAGLAHLRLTLGDPTIDRRDWASLAWALAAAAGLVLAGALGVLATSDQLAAPGDSQPGTVAMMTLAPSQLVASAELAPQASSVPALALGPSLSTAEFTGQRGSTTESVPMQQVVPAMRIEPAEQVRFEYDRGLFDGLLELN